MRLTAEEKETIISFNEADTLADVEVFNARLMREIRKAAATYPNEVTIKEGTDGAYLVTFPKKWIKIRAPRILTDEERERLSAQGKRLGFQKKS